MSDEKPRNGFTVSELEAKFKKHGLEVTLCAIFILSAIFTLIWGGAMVLWSILLSMILAIVGALFHVPIKKFLHVNAEKIYKEKTACIVVAVVGVLLSIIFPVIIFAIIGLVAGKSLAHIGCHCSDQNIEK